MQCYIAIHILIFTFLNIGGEGKISNQKTSVSEWCNEKIRPNYL
jgi:hypothetical protein